MCPVKWEKVLKASISSRMIIEEPDAQYLQKHGDMIYKNGDTVERAQGYLIEIEELDQIVSDVINGKYWLLGGNVANVSELCTCIWNIQKWD